MFLLELQFFSIWLISQISFLRNIFNNLYKNCARKSYFGYANPVMVLSQACFIFMCEGQRLALCNLYMSLIAFKGLDFLKLHIGFKIMMFSFFWKHFQWFLMLFSYLKHLHSAYLIQISCFVFPWIDRDRHIILKCAKLIGLM